MTSDEFLQIYDTIRYGRKV